MEHKFIILFIFYIIIHLSFLDKSNTLEIDADGIIDESNYQDVLSTAKDGQTSQLTEEIVAAVVGNSVVLVHHASLTCILK